jgi:hypothetical protein
MERKNSASKVASLDVHQGIFQSSSAPACWIEVTKVVIELYV